MTKISLLGLDSLIETFLLPCHGGRRGGGSFFVKIPGDVPPARVYFFGLQPGKGYTFGKFNLGKGFILAIWSKNSQILVIPV